VGGTRRHQGGKKKLRAKVKNIRGPYDQNGKKMQQPSERRAWRIGTRVEQKNAERGKRGLKKKLLGEKGGGRKRTKQKERKKGKGQQTFPPRFRAPRREGESGKPGERGGGQKRKKSPKKKKMGKPRLDEGCTEKGIKKRRITTRSGKRPC